MPRGTRSIYSIAGEVGAHKLHASIENPSEHTRPAREAFNRKFEDEVDPDRKLPESERRRRAEHARKAHFARLTMLSIKARRAKAGGDVRTA